MKGNNSKWMKFDVDLVMRSLIVNPTVDENRITSDTFRGHGPKFCEHVWCEVIVHPL